MMWDLKSLKSSKLSRLVQQTNSTEMSQILALVHFPTCNQWGMIYVDFLTRSIFPMMGWNLKLLQIHFLWWRQALIYCRYFSLQVKHSKWISGLPLRTSLGLECHQECPWMHSVGIGSWWVGVILAAMDFISLGPGAVHNLPRKFSDMQQHKIQPMCHILSWSEALWFPLSQLPTTATLVCLEYPHLEVIV